MKRLQRGILIAFEGIDGAGKTTQARLAFDYLSKKGYSCVYLKEPTDGPIGQKIRAFAIAGREKVSPFEEFNLFLKDRIEDVEKNIKPALAEKKIVLIDRYYYSSIAYQGALGIDPNFIRTENEKIAPIPDRVYYLSILPELSTDRIISYRGDSVNLFEKREYLEKVKSIFDSIDTSEIMRIDGSLKKEEIQKKIQEDIKGIIKSISK